MCVEACMTPREALLRAVAMVSAGVGSLGGGGRGSKGGPYLRKISEKEF